MTTIDKYHQLHPTWQNKKRASIGRYCLINIYPPSCSRQRNRHGHCSREQNGPSTRSIHEVPSINKLKICIISDGAELTGEVSLPHKIRR